VCEKKAEVLVKEDAEKRKDNGYKYSDRDWGYKDMFLDGGVVSGKGTANSVSKEEMDKLLQNGQDLLDSDTSFLDEFEKMLEDDTDQLDIFDDDWDAF
jgi:hypothetical protein